MAVAVGGDVALWLQAEAVHACFRAGVTHLVKLIIHVSSLFAEFRCRFVSSLRLSESWTLGVTSYYRVLVLLE
jgi:hypothetical protein